MLLKGMTKMLMVVWFINSLRNNIYSYQEIPKKKYFEIVITF